MTQGSPFLSVRDCGVAKRESKENLQVCKNNFQTLKSMKNMRCKCELTNTKYSSFWKLKLKLKQKRVFFIFIRFLLNYRHFRTFQSSSGRSAEHPPTKIFSLTRENMKKRKGKIMLLALVDRDLCFQTHFKVL